MLGPPYRLGRRLAARSWFALLRPARVGLPGGRCMYLDRTDGRSYALWESRGNVNRRSMDLWQRLLPLCPWSLVLDVGANHGEMLLFPTLPAGARVLAFEPNATIAPLLRRSLADSGVAAEVIEAAVGSFDGRITLHVDLRWSGTTSTIAVNTSGTHRTVEVPITRLDTVLAGLDGLPPDGHLLVKIDVEGHEWEVLQGLLPAIGQFRRVAIMAEVHRLPPASFASVCTAFDVAILDQTGTLRFNPAPQQAALPDMDVVLLPKHTARDYGIVAES